MCRDVSYKVVFFLVTWGGLVFFSFSALHLASQDDYPLPYFEVSKLSGLNTKGLDFSPVLLGKTLVFVSERETDLVNYGENRFSRQPYLSVFQTGISVHGDSIRFDRIREFPGRINIRRHTGPICFSGNGKKAVFTRVMMDKNKGERVLRPKLFEVQKNGSGWKKPELLNINLPGYSFGHPSLSDDGKLFVFSSDMPDGFGGKDMYFCKRTKKSWGKPVNLGKEINSAGDEVFPVLWNDSVLFFSSNGREGAQGLDIYVSFFRSGQWGQAVRLDTVINSKWDDFSLFLEKDGKTGFFSSNRPGGMGGDDIYRVHAEWRLPEKVRGYNIAGKFVYLKLGQELPEGIKVQLVGEDGVLLYNTIADKNGSFLFENLPYEKNYIIRLEEDIPDLKLVLLGEGESPVAELLPNEEREFVYKKLSYENLRGMSVFYTVNSSEILGMTRALRGQLNYRNLTARYPEDIKVMLVNDKGEIIYTTLTDKKGRFTFINLPKDEVFIVKTEPMDVALDLRLFNADQVIAELSPDETGAFLYVKLAHQAVGSLHLLDETDPVILLEDYSTSLIALFRYKDKKRPPPPRMKIEVLNERGEQVAVATTDEYGKIFIRKLPSGQNLKFRVDSADGRFKEQIEMVVLGFTDETIAVISRDEDGVFFYSMLKPERGSMTAITTEDESLKLTGQFSIENVYFDYKSTDLDREAREKLDLLISVLLTDPKMKVHITTHADSRGGDEYNLKLTTARADAITGYIISKGISSGRISSRAYGRALKKIECTDCTEEQHRLNRRAEFEIYM